MQEERLQFIFSSYSDYLKMNFFDQQGLLRALLLIQQHISLHE